MAAIVPWLAGVAVAVAGFALLRGCCTGASREPCGTANRARAHAGRARPLRAVRIDTATAAACMAG
jgi:hypothetical protein